MSKKVKCECGLEISAYGLASHKEGNTHKTRMKRMEWLEKHPGWRLIEDPYLVGEFKRIAPETNFKWEILEKALWIPGYYGVAGRFKDMLGVEKGVRRRALVSAIKKARKESRKEYDEIARRVYRELRRIGIPAKLIRARKRLYNFTTCEVKSPEGIPQVAVNVYWRRRSENLPMEEGLFVKDGRSWFYASSLARLESLKPMVLEAFDTWKRQGEWYFVKNKPSAKGSPDGWKFVVEGEESAFAAYSTPPSYALGGTNHLVVSAKRIIQTSKDRRGLTLQKEGRPEVDPLPPLGFTKPPIREWVQYIIYGPARVEHKDHEDLELEEGMWFVFRGNQGD